jgi:hypothetical protein
MGEHPTRSGLDIGGHLLQIALLGTGQILDRPGNVTVVNILGAGAGFAHIGGYLLEELGIIENQQLGFKYLGQLWADSLAGVGANFFQVTPGAGNCPIKPMEFGINAIGRNWTLDDWWSLDIVLEAETDCDPGRRSRTLESSFFARFGSHHQLILPSA